MWTNLIRNENVDETNEVLAEDVLLLSYLHIWGRKKPANLLCLSHFNVQERFPSKSALKCRM